MKIIAIQPATIENLKRQWPCHYVPDDLDVIVAAFDDDGSLVDYEGFTDTDLLIDYEEFERCDASGFLSAILNDAWEHATKNKQPDGIIDTGWTY